MLKRLIYTCCHLYKNRYQLRRYNCDHSLQAATIHNLAPKMLLARGIKALIVDFDGVLASHGKTKPTLAAEEWLTQCVNTFGINRIFILSNKPTSMRKMYFDEHFADKICFFRTTHKKPFPNDLYYILQQLKVTADEVLLIDDRLATGILASIIAQIKGCLITEPLVDIAAYPICESFFIVLRKLERLVFKWL